MGDVARFDDRFRKRIWRIILASVVMGLCLWAAALAMSGPLGTTGLRYIALLILILIGAVSYFGTGHLIGAFKLSDFKRAAKRK